jgi:hypothetical protein
VATPVFDAEQTKRNLQASARNAFGLKRLFPPYEAAGPNSTFGGEPRLAQTTAWPRHPETGRSLSFLAQIDLAELPNMPDRDLLPAEGSLAFFAGLNSSGGQYDGAVVYSELSLRTMPYVLPPADTPIVSGELPPGWLSDEIREQHASKYQRRAYPRMPVEIRPLVTYDSTGHWLADAPETVELHRLQLAAADAAFGKGAGPRYSDPSVTRAMNGDGSGDSAFVYSGPVLFPEETWPHAWYVVNAFTLSIGEELRQAQRSPNVSADIKPALERATMQADRWLSDATVRSPWDPLALDVHGRFREWCAELGKIKGYPFANRVVGQIDASLYNAELWAAENDGEHRKLLPEAVLKFLHSSMPDRYLTHTSASSESDVLSFQMQAHQMLGHREYINDIETAGRTLLLQLNSDCIWSWGDVGTLGFWIAPEDLAARRFDRAILMQSG